MAKKQKDLMLTKEEIQIAIEESQQVKKKYPAFWKFHCMLLDLNDGLMTLEKTIKEDKK